jgi:hypothetical protein
MLTWKATAAAPTSQRAGKNARRPRRMRRPESAEAKSHSDNCMPTSAGRAHRKTSPMMSRQRIATTTTTKVATKPTISTEIAPASTLVEGHGDVNDLAVLMTGA